ncbi:MAG TPA: glycosyltransferase [Actinomycetota bacterium]
MTLHVGLATTLPPAPTGPAEFVAGVLPELARAARITCFVDDPGLVEPALRHRFDIRALDARTDPDIDVVVYHIANNLAQLAIYQAAMEGPPGLLEIHDGSLHHTLADLTLGADNAEAYQDLLRQEHGAAGDRLADLHIHGHRGSIELFMFDLLKGVLDRHLGAVVHNRYAADLIALRAPALPTWVVPLSAPVPAPPASREALGLPDDALVIAHFGFVTQPKRPFLLLDAFARLRASGRRCHLLFAGQDDTSGRLAAEIARLGLTGAVTITGYLERRQMDALISTVDIVVSLRFPHVGETSATLGAALAAGRPVVVQETGSWAELPEHAVLRVPAGGDETAALEAALDRLASNPLERARFGEAARAYAAGSLGAGRYAESIVDAARAVAVSSRVPPSTRLERRRADVAAFLANGAERLTTGTLLMAAPAPLEALRALPPARPGARLLDIGGSPAFLRILECVWGYEVRGCRLAGMPASGGRPSCHVDLVNPATGVLPHGCGDFDVVTCWEGAAVDLAEVNRVLKPEGLLVLTSRSGPDGLRRFLEHAGLAVEVMAPAGKDLTMAVARKVGLPALNVAGTGTLVPAGESLRA